MKAGLFVNDFKKLSLGKAGLFKQVFSESGLGVRHSTKSGWRPQTIVDRRGTNVTRGGQFLEILLGRIYFSNYF